MKLSRPLRKASTAKQRKQEHICGGRHNSQACNLQIKYDGKPVGFEKSVEKQEAE